MDLDGVLYRGEEPVEGASAALARARTLVSRVLFLTNNSARTPSEVAERLRGVGVPAASEDVLTSGMALAARLRREGTNARTAFVIGERGVRRALEEVGFAVVDGEPAHADLVVVGWDRSLDYAKLRTAALLVQRGARLVATNADPTYPAPDGLWPGAGSILAAVVTATGSVPMVAGKPNPPLFEAAAERAGASRPLVVGDRLDTDVEGAARMGWDSLLVLTGASSPPDLLRARAVPTFVSPTLDRLLADVPPARFRPAGPEDRSAVGALLEACELSTADFDARLGGTLVSTSDPQVEVDATACLVEVDGFGILRSVAVRTGARGSGLGSLAVAAAAGEARHRGIGQLWLFTDGGEAFFERLGFRAERRDRLPGPIEASPHATDECARSATPMRADLVVPQPGDPMPPDQG
jgi:HAD superfamily hydrolase (TIGR01457 family)